MDDAIATLATLVSTIDDPDFDPTNPDDIGAILDYINIQCRAVVENESSESTTP